MLVYYLYRIAEAIVPLLPRRLGYWLFARFGDIVFLFSARRQVVRNNLRYVLGPKVSAAELNRLAREVFRNQLRNYFDLFSLRRLEPQDIERRVQMEALTELLRGLDDGRGLVVVSPHFGNLDVIMQAVALLELEALLVVERLKPEKLFQLISSLRMGRGLNLVPVDAAPRRIFRALKDNQIVLLAADRDVTNSGTVVDFFGAPARLPDGYARIVRRTGARLGVGFSLRQPDNTFVVRGHLLPPLEPSSDRDADVRTIVQQVVAIMERYIGEYPEQWVMFQPIWSDQQSNHQGREVGRSR